MKKFIYIVVAILIAYAVLRVALWLMGIILSVFWNLFIVAVFIVLAIVIYNMLKDKF